MKAKVDLTIITKDGLKIGLKEVKEKKRMEARDTVMSDEDIVKELCKVLAIRYGYADGEAIDWILKNIIKPLREDYKDDA